MGRKNKHHENKFIYLLFRLLQLLQCSVKNSTRREKMKITVCPDGEKAEKKRGICQNLFLQVEV